MAGESIQARDEALLTFEDLGPPDLCQIIKNIKGAETYSYHFVTGVESSSSASLGAYITSTSAKLVSGTYCCWNAFSKCDVRVIVRIPGGVESFAVDERGTTIPLTPILWTEVMISAGLRSLVVHYDSLLSASSYNCSQSSNYGSIFLLQMGLVNCSLFNSIEDETRFLDVAADIFEKGILFFFNL
jgi:hypothetical protein